MDLPVDPFLFVFQIRYARFLRTYAKKYCTETTVSPFLIYFPFILFLVPSLIIFIEKGLKRYICHILFRDYGIEELPPDIQKFLFRPPATKILLNLRSCRSILQGDHGGQWLCYFDINLVVILLARLCLGSCKEGRSGKAVGQDSGTSRISQQNAVSDHYGNHV